MRKSYLLILALIAFLVALLLLPQIIPARAEDDPCAFFDQWTGEQRFDYVVNNGEWNLPADVQNPTTGKLNDPKTISFRNSGIWMFYSPSQNALYWIIFRNYDADGTPLGQHKICAYVDYQ